MLLSCNRASDDSVIVYTLATPENYRYPDDNIKVSYEIITLENSGEESLLPDISELHIHNNRLYLRAGGGVYIFDDNGKFVKSLAQGRGPGEFIGARDILINEDDGLEVLSRQFIYRFNSDGEFMDNIELPKRLIMEFAKIDDRYLLSTPRITPKTTNFFYLYDPMTKEEIPLMQGVERPLFDFQFNLFADDKGKVNFTTLYSGLFYGVDNKLNIEKVFKFEPTIAEDKLMDPIVDYDEIEKISNNCYQHFLYCRLVSQKYISIQAIYGDRGPHFIYNLTNGLTYYSLFEDFPPVRFIGNDSEWLYYTISPVAVERMKEREFKTDACRKLAEDLGRIVGNDSVMEGNPIIVKVKYE